eukprot:2471127-Amphidinium_carterae.1
MHFDALNSCNQKKLRIGSQRWEGMCSSATHQLHVPLCKEVAHEDTVTTQLSCTIVRTALGNPEQSQSLTV